MTLHLTKVTRRYVLQISDRLLTKNLGEIHDTLANKNVIYLAQNALVTIGYTGIAYLGDTTTDQWIAEKLRGEPFPRGQESHFSVSIGVPKRWFKIEQAVRILKDELEAAVKKLPSNQRQLGFSVVIAGWREDRHNRWNPLLVHINKPTNATAFHVTHSPRHLFYEGRGTRSMIYAMPKGYLSDSEIKEIHDRTLASNSPYVLDRVNKSEFIFVEEIRKVAGRTKTVGPHCMSILLPQPFVAPIRIRLIPERPYQIVLTGQINKLPLAFSPWVVSPRTILAPSLMVGWSPAFDMGPFHVVVEGPKSDDMTYLGSHRRQQRP